METRCKRVDMEEVWRSGALEMRCRRVDVEVFASRALEPCYRCREEEVSRRAAGVQTWRQGRMEIWRPGGMLRARGRCLKRGREVCCGPGDVEV